FVRGAAHSGVAEMARSARSLGGSAAALTAAAKPSPTPSATGNPSAAATPAATPSPVPTSANGTSTWQTALGHPTLVSPQVKKLFNEVNCADKNWQQKIGYTPQVWNDPQRQIVSCGSLNGVMYKFALDKSLVLGSQIKNASASLQQGSTFWQVNL